MNTRFRNLNELINYYTSLDSYEQYRFVNEVNNNIYYIHSRLNKYKGIIFSILSEDPDDKFIVLETGRHAKEAMDLSLPYDFRGYDISREFSVDEVIKLYNEYLEIVYKTIYYFSKIYAVSTMFSKMAYGFGEYGIVPGCITGVYDGVNNGYDKDELLAKYSRMLLNVDKSFEEEWKKLNKFEIYKLK